MDKSARAVFDLIAKATSLEVLRSFLKSKNLPSSAGSWDLMLEKRIEPAYDVGAITYDDLLGVLRDVEEHGRQHVFLYTIKPERARALASSGRVARIAAEQSISGVLGAPLALDLPAKPTIVDIRNERFRIRDEVVETTVIKQVETRETVEFLGKKPTSTGFVKEYGVEKTRAVNVARLFNSGLLELRIAARDNTTRYHDDVKALFAAVRPFLPHDEFAPLSLRKAKDRLWKDRASLGHLVRYSSYKAKNDFGVTMSAATGSFEDDLVADEGAKKGMQAFIDSNGFGHSSNVFFKIPNSSPAREVHVLISGESNEFALTAACSAEDYKYVLEQILSFNQ